MSFHMPIGRKAALVSNTSYCYIKSLELKSMLVLVPPAPCFKEATKPSKENTQTHTCTELHPEGGK